jgi:hypothetical protein
VSIEFNKNVDLQQRCRTSLLVLKRLAATSIVARATGRIIFPNEFHVIGVSRVHAFLWNSSCRIAGQESHMTRELVLTLLVLCALVVLPSQARAQEATLSGTVTDSTGGVLPGVTITAVHEATGNSFFATTDGTGGYRLPVRIGIYKLTADLQGFATFTRTGMEINVGQQAMIDIKLSPDTVQESVTVTGAAPLVDVSSSDLSKAIDSRQMKDLPVNGRNWVDLAMLAAGSRTNASTDEPGTVSGAAGVGSFQLNLDGLRVTQNQTSGFGQPHYSRDAIAEFEYVSGRFDATQGGSMGVQINAVTKSGTNTPSGSFSSYFRDDSMIGKDFVQDRVLPYSDQQINGTWGGPIIKDRLHYFGSYEYERQPQTITYSSPYPTFNFDQTGTYTENKGTVRVDYQISSKSRLSVRGNGFGSVNPYDPRYTGGASRHPSSAIKTTRHSNDYLATLTQVLGSTTVNEARIGYAGFRWVQDSVVDWPDHPNPSLKTGTPILSLRGYTIGQGHGNSHEDEDVETYTAHDNLTFSFTKGGRHDVKVGGEFIYQGNPVFLCNTCMGKYDMSGGPAPADLEQLFPVWNDVSTWNLAALSDITRSYTLTIGTPRASAPLTVTSGWLQDDWHVGTRLTLNLGVRYDFETGVFAEATALPPFLTGDRRNDTNNFGPRLGFAYRLTDQTVIRGGGGIYYGDPGSQKAYWTKLWSNQLSLQLLNDGRPDFASNPFNGPVPTYDQALTLTCLVSSAANCLRPSVQGTLAAPGDIIPYSTQASLGFQKQLSASAVIEADYVYVGNRDQFSSMNVNLAYDAATGTNYPFTDLSKRPYPQWGEVDETLTNGASTYHALQASFTKRMGHGWQASATYLLSGQWNKQVAPIAPGCQYPTTMTTTGSFVCDTPIALAPDIQSEWYLSPDQRQRVTFNAIWDAKWGLQLSGTYLYGDNGWATATSGVDIRQTGATGGSRLLADGTLIPRNNFDIPSIHKVDLRAQRQFSLGGRVKISGIVELYNAFNHQNLVTYVTNLANARYGQPSGDSNLAYQPRMVQLGFRTTF